MVGSAAGDEGVVDTETLIARVNLITHATVRSAVDRLQNDHRNIDADNAFRALYHVAKRHDVKLRHLAAAVVETEPRSDIRSLDEPELPFQPGRRAGLPSRTDVMADLLAEAVELTSADAAAVHLRHALHGGLCIERDSGLGEGFRRQFSYVDDAGSAAGRSSARCEVVRIDDVSTSPIYTRADVAVLADEGIRAQLAVPMCDETGSNWGAVDVLFTQRHPRIDPFGVDMLHGHADACAQWLRWYDLTVMPKLVAAVHRAARATGSVDVASA